MIKFFSLFFYGLRKDLLNAMSYRLQFFGSFAIIFFNLTIYFFFLEFINSQNMNEKNIEYFKYLFFGLMMIDFSMILARSLSGPITTYKNQGIFEELMSLPVSELQIVLNSAPFAIINGLLRIFCFLLFYLYMYGTVSIDSFELIMLLLSMALFILCSLGISLIFSSITLIFHRGEGLPFIYTAFSTLLGGVFYPVNIISDKLVLISNLLPIKHILEIFRGSLGLSDYSTDHLIFNMIFLAILSVLFCFFGKLLFDKSLAIAKKKASLYVY